MHSSPPFPHVQHAQDNTGDSSKKIEKIPEIETEEGLDSLFFFGIAFVLILGLIIGWESKFG